MEQLLSIIGQMYDAALDPSLWTGVLEQICTYLHVAQVVIVYEDALDPGNSTFLMSFSDPEWLARYVESYLLINPMRLAMVTRAGAGEVILTTDFMSPEEYENTPFSREFLVGRGIVDIAVAVLDKTATSITVLSAQRGREHGFADEEVRRKLDDLLPHAQRAIAIGRLFEQKTMQTATLADTLDRLTAAVFLLDESGTIVHANEAAHGFVVSATLLRSVGNRLLFKDADAAAMLAKALSSAAKGDAAIGNDGRSMALRAEDGKPYIAVVMPLTGGARRKVGKPYRAVAAICIKQADYEAASSVDALASLHHLTRREAAVLVANVELGNVAKTAAVLGLSENTVKVHLRTIFRKTGAVRQSDLVKLLSGVATPFQ